MSPGFRDHRDTEPSFELKYVVDPAVADRVLAWARDRLEADHWGDPALDGAYVVHTLYLDTPALDVYHRSPSFRRRKFRARRYGDDATIHLEQKTRTGDRVAKRRTAVDGDALESMAGSGAIVTAPWTWFRHRVSTRRLQPVVRVTYLRSAFVGSAGPEGPMRLTVDDRIEAEAEAGWIVAPVSGGREVLGGRRVVELKYRRALPSVFKDLITRLGLSPAAFSKYRTAVRELGIGPAEIR
jgi:hypothetical protein